MLKFNVRNQSISRIDNFRPAEKSIKYLLAHFDFKTEDWKETVKTAVFRNTKTGKPYDAILDGNMCVVPWEVLSESGVFEVSVYGIKEDGSRITTDIDVVNLNSTIYGGSATQDPSPTVYETLVLGIDKLENKVGELEDKFENFEPSQPSLPGGNITVDSELSTESKNPVQNMVVTQKFNDIDEDIEELSRKVEEGNVTSEKITTALGYTPANQEDVSKLSEEIGDLEEQVEAITKQDYEWVIPQYELVEGKLVALNSNLEGFWLNDNADGRYIKLKKGDITKIRANGFQWNASYRFFSVIFTDTVGKVLDYYTADTDNAEFSVELDVPEGTEYIYINGHKKNGDLSVLAYMPKDAVTKKLITLGDSITALGIGDTGWVKYFIEKTNCQLVANVAVSGAWLMDKTGTVYDGNPVFNGADDNVNNVLGNQVQKIINNNYEAPDIIMIAIGTNAGISITQEQMKAVYYGDGNTLIPLENVDRTTSAGAYRWCLEKLHETYPNAIIFWCTPVHGAQDVRLAEGTMRNAESLRIATEYTGQIMIDTIRCGISGATERNNVDGEYLADGLHPNINGAKKIGYYNASKVMPFLDNVFELV